MRFVETLEAQLMPRSTNLEILRKRATLSQSQLAAMSGVSMRSIQMYEQRKNDIARAQFNTLDALARVLNCSVYDLTEDHLLERPSHGVFMQQLAAQTEPYWQPFGVMDAGQIQQQARMDAYRTGYVAQFPVEQINVQPNGYVIPQAVFMNNWNSYWDWVMEQQHLSEIERENRAKIIQKLAKEAISQGLKASGNYAAATAFDAMCAITADNVADAVFKALSVIAAVRN